MGQGDIERKLGQQGGHDIEAAHGKPRRRDQPFFLHPHQRSDGPVAGTDLVEIPCMFRVMQMQDLKAVYSQRFEAFLHGAAGAIPVKPARFHIPVELGRQDKPLRQTAPFAQRGADPGFAAPKAVIA